MGAFRFYRADCRHDNCRRSYINQIQNLNTAGKTHLGMSEWTTPSQHEHAECIINIDVV